MRSVLARVMGGGIWVLGAILQAGAQAAPPEPTRVWDGPFFPFCIDWHDAKKRSFGEQAQMLRELGYPGVGHLWLDQVEERLAALDPLGLRLYQITLKLNLTPGQEPYDQARWQRVLTAVRGRGVQFLLICQGYPPGDPAGEPRAVELVRTMAAEAQPAGAQLLVYPHWKDWVERLEHAVHVAERVDRPNVGVMFNLCHWLRTDPSRDYRPLLQRALPRLWAVSINGADERDDQRNWKRYIQPLDQGNFDVRGLLVALDALGYRGPVGLQCYGIPGDVRDHLDRSLARWREWGGRTVRPAEPR